MPVNLSPQLQKCISIYVVNMSWKHHVVEVVQWCVMWCLCGPARCFKVCKLSKPAGCQRCAASSLWRSGGFPSGVSRLFNQCHERGLCFRSLPPKSWSHPVTIEQTPQCRKRRGTTQAWDEVRGSDWLYSITQIPEAITFMRKLLIRPRVSFKLCICILCKDKS